MSVTDITAKRRRVIVFFDGRSASNSADQWCIERAIDNAPRPRVGQDWWRLTARGKRRSSTTTRGVMAPL